ncbi:Uridine kinase [Microlunatus flavus]|uniref:Uridine kinase n=1 Tax=Microlunatus flavus TaxID=1036181 RepID=A0A1H9M9B1_9ACTN|nr:Uridine kinase [Microlunatus flavus]
MVRVGMGAVPALVRERLAGLAGTRWVGIDGKGASGKTTLAERVAAAVPGAVVVHVDDFARPSVETWERERFVGQVLQPLLAGRPGRYERWDWGTDASLGWATVPVGVPVVVEGVSSTDVRLGVPWDVTLWVDVPREVRLARALARDGEGMREQWVGRWMPAEDAYEAAQRPQQRVDAIVVAEF